MFRVTLVLVVLAVATLAASPRCFAQRPLRSLALDSSRGSISHHEVDRRRQIADQLNLIDQMQWYYPSASTIYYRYPSTLSDIYAYGRRATVYGPVFEPWPYVPGDIWGYLPNDYVRQPIGQRQVQTGPNRWESYPVYDDEEFLTPPPAPRRAAPVERPRSGPREF